MRPHVCALRFAAILAVVAASSVGPPVQANNAVETIVVVRHAEKPRAGLGQLTCRGLNRALKLPAWFAAHVPPPDAIFAPDPSVKVMELHGLRRYDYVRPLLTIGPTAIRAGLPIDTQIPYDAPGRLADTLLERRYHDATVYVAWEHRNIVRLAKILLDRFGNRDKVPHWSDGNYDTVFVLTIDWGKPRRLKFTVRSEDIGPLAGSCPE